MNTPQFICIKEVIDLIGLSRSTIYEKINPNSKYYDATFPRPHPLGDRRVAWLKHEVLNWILSVAKLQTPLN